MSNIINQMRESKGTTDDYFGGNQSFESEDKVPYEATQYLGGGLW